MSTADGARSEDIQLLKERFAPFLEPQVIYNLCPPPPAGVKSEAAVLILLERRTDDWYVFFTLRSMHLRSHGGEVSFPGGKREPTDLSSIETALRETNEETGIPYDAVLPIGSLPHVITRFGILIHPVVAILQRPVEFVPNEEVEKCFWAPLSIFLSSNNHERIEFKSVDLVTHRFLHDEEVIFGITSYISILVAMCVFRRHAEFDMGADRNAPVVAELHLQFERNHRPHRIVDQAEYRSHALKNKL